MPFSILRTSAAQVAAQQRPELRKRAFALVRWRATGRVCRCGQQSSAFAVESRPACRGYKRRHSPKSLSLRRVPEDEVAAQAILHTIACMFSPRIEYVEIYPGTYALDIRGMNGLFGDETQLANKLRQRIMTAGFLANVAVAQNFDAAVCLARGRTGVSVVPPGHEANALRDLPLHVLNLSERSTRRPSRRGASVPAGSSPRLPKPI